MQETLPVFYNAKALNKEHNRGSRSIPTVVATDGVVHKWEPCYIRKCDLVSIFNVSIPYEEHYKNGVLVTKPNFHRGQPFNDAVYIEGCEHTYDFMMKEAKFPMIFRDIVCGDTLECSAYIKLNLADIQRMTNAMPRR